MQEQTPVRKVKKPVKKTGNPKPTRKAVKMKKARSMKTTANNPYASSPVQSNMKANNQVPSSGFGFPGVM